jgi:hypothetical protein
LLIRVGERHWLYEPQYVFLALAAAQRVAIKNQNVPIPGGGYGNRGIGILANLGSVKVVTMTRLLSWCVADERAFSMLHHSDLRCNMTTEG